MSRYKIHRNTPNRHPYKIPTNYSPKDPLEYPPQTTFAKPQQSPTHDIQRNTSNKYPCGYLTKYLPLEHVMGLNPGRCPSTVWLMHWVGMQRTFGLPALKQIIIVYKSQITFKMPRNTSTNTSATTPSAAPHGMQRNSPHKLPRKKTPNDLQMVYKKPCESICANPATFAPMNPKGPPRVNNG